MQKILIIIPAYNEEECILKTYQSIIDYNQVNGTNYDVIVINDCSTDRTPEILDEHNIPHIDLIHNLGIGGAVQTGYRYGMENGYDIAVQYDGDGQHDVAYITKICEPIINNRADLVIGSRYVDKKESEFQSSWARRMGIKVISFAIFLVTGKHILDTTSGFRAVNRDIMKYFAEHYPTEYPESITTTECLRMGYKVEEVSVSMHERLGGQSSIHSWKIIYFMLNVVLSVLMCKIRRYRKR